MKLYIIVQLMITLGMATSLTLPTEPLASATEGVEAVVEMEVNAQAVEEVAEEAMLPAVGETYARTVSCTCSLSISLSGLEWCRGTRVRCRKNGINLCFNTNDETDCSCGHCGNEQ